MPLEHEHRQPAAGEQQRRRQPDRPGADDDDGVPGHRASVVERRRTLHRRRSAAPPRLQASFHGCDPRHSVRAESCVPAHATSGPRRRGRRGGPVPVNTRGAIMRSAPGKWEVVDLVVDDPQRRRAPGQAGRLRAVPLRRPRRHRRHAGRHYPMLGGHEGAGVVTAVGPGTKGFKEGDHVVFSFLPGLRPVPLVRAAASSTSATSAPNLLVGARFDDADELPGHHVRRARTSARCAARAPSPRSPPSTSSRRSKIADDIPLEVACLVGCGVGTGWGIGGQGRRGRARRDRRSSWASAASASTPSRARRTPAPATSSPSTRSRSSARRRMELGATDDLREHRGGRRVRPQRHQRPGRGQGDRHRRCHSRASTSPRPSTRSGKGGRVVVTGLGDLTDVRHPDSTSAS